MQSKPVEECAAGANPSPWREGQLRYRITSLRASSAKYGACEVCQGQVSDVHYQVEERYFVILPTERHSGTQGWTQHQCTHLYGHESCLVGRRRGVLRTAAVDEGDGRLYAVHDPAPDASADACVGMAGGPVNERLRSAVVTRLQELGWFCPGGTAVARRIYRTAVGDKEAHAYLEGFGSGSETAVLKGLYYSEGRNCLEPYAVLIPKAATDEVIAERVVLFASQVDAVIAETYAVRLAHAISAS